MGFSILIMQFIVYNFYTGIDQIDGISRSRFIQKKNKNSQKGIKPTYVQCFCCPWGSRITILSEHMIDNRIRLVLNHK